MYRPNPTEGQVNANYKYLEKGRGDESPSFIRAAHRSVLFDDVKIQPTSEKPLHSKSGLSKREKWMIAGLILLAVLCIVFIVLFATSGKEEKKKARERPDNESKEWITLASGECILVFC